MSWSIDGKDTQPKCTQITHTNVDGKFELLLHQCFLDSLAEARITSRSSALDSVIDEATYFIHFGILLLRTNIAVCVHILINFFLKTYFDVFW